MVNLYVIILHGLLEKEIGGVLFIFITGKVGLGGLALGKPKTLKALDCLHFLRSYPHGTSRLLSSGTAVTTEATTRHRLVCSAGSSIAARTACHN